MSPVYIQFRTYCGIAKPALIDGIHFESFSLKRVALFFKTEIGVRGGRHLPGGPDHFGRRRRVVKRRDADEQRDILRRVDGAGLDSYAAPA
jgi:hypothetical protein